MNPIRYFCRDHHIPDPTWGSPYLFDDDGLGTDAALSRVQSTFLDDEARLLATVLLADPAGMPGELLGVVICLYMGARNNEAAGVSFREFKQMLDYPGEYTLTIGALTTIIGKNALKVSGKTYNAPRIVPVLDKVAAIILMRIEYLNSVLTFPLETENGVFQSVWDLPIACKGNDYTKRCSAVDIGDAATNLFRNVLHFDENRIAGITKLMFRDPERFVEERSATCYTCRRDYASELSEAFYGLPDQMTYIQYLMGHKIEDLRFKRNDLTDEYYLHDMKRLLEASHRVNQFGL